MSEIESNMRIVKLRAAASNRPLTDLFHAHLDVCKHCVDHPFDLCPEGNRLLIDAFHECERIMREVSGL